LSQLGQCSQCEADLVDFLIGMMHHCPESRK
jgi:hypothetical protein